MIKATTNDITGDEIRTHFNSHEYVSGWERIWGKKNELTVTAEEHQMMLENLTHHCSTLFDNKILEPQLETW